MTHEELVEIITEKFIVGRRFVNHIQTWDLHMRHIRKLQEYEKSSDRLSLLMIYGITLEQLREAQESARQAAKRRYETE